MLLTSAAAKPIMLVPGCFAVRHILSGHWDRFGCVSADAGRRLKPLTHRNTTGYYKAIRGTRLLRKEEIHMRNGSCHTIPRVAAASLLLLMLVCGTTIAQTGGNTATHGVLAQFSQPDPLGIGPSSGPSAAGLRRPFSIWRKIRHRRRHIQTRRKRYLEESRSANLARQAHH